MNKHILGRIFVIGFFVIFFLMVGIMVKEFIEQKNDNKAQKERYEQMIASGSKTVLTNDILEEDHDKYLADIAEGKRIFITLLICFGSVIVWFVVYYIISLILKGREEGASSSMLILCGSFAVVLIMIGSFAIIAVKMIVPALTRDREKEGYYFNELNISDAERREVTEKVKDGDSYRTETRVYYYLFDENGKEIAINEVLYSRYVGEGVYYCGQTAGGKVFSVYPDKYFELAE